MPELSIIIPTLNEEENIGKLLKSLKKQTYKDFEVIIVDGNSTDKTRKIIKEFAKKFPKIKLMIDRKRSIGRARNVGARQAKGHYFLFLDADTLLSRRFLKKCLSEFRKKSLDIATAEFKSLSKQAAHRLYYGLHNVVIGLMQFFHPYAQGVFLLVKRNLFEKIKGFDEKIKLGEDVNFVERANEFGKFGVLNSVAVKVSPRRLEKEGILSTIMKYLLCYFHREVIGEVKSDILKYKFGKYK